MIPGNVQNPARKPPGTTDFWPAANPPSGALVRDGSSISRSTYARLFSVIGTDYGAGDGLTTFNLPDDRGEFVRGADEARGTAAGNVGATQSDVFKEHRHRLTSVDGQGNTNGANNALLALHDDQSNQFWRYSSSGDQKSNIQAMDKRGGIETRPRNRAYLPIIWH